MVIITILTSLIILAAGLYAPYRLYFRPMSQHHQQAAQSRLWREQQTALQIEQMEHKEMLERLKQVAKISRIEKRKAIDGAAQLGIRYRYRSADTRRKKKTLYEKMRIKAEMVGMDYLCYSVSLPQNVAPSRVLKEEFQDDFRIKVRRPDVQFIATEREGLFLFVPLRGSMDGIPNLYEWSGTRSSKDALKILPPDRPYALPVGLGSNRQFFYIDLTDPKSSSPHLLTAGSTGGGKSNLMNVFISTLILRNSPEKLKFLMIDLKRVELHPYRNIPHLFMPVVTRTAKVVPALDAIYEEMERRLELFTTQDIRSIYEWNKQNEEHHQVPRLFLIIDELALVIQTAKKEAEERISQLAALGRAAGIHLLAFTQRPSVDVVTGLIKTNMPDRVAFNTDEQGSKTILGNIMAKGLEPKGRAIFYSSGRYSSIQTPLIHSEQIAAAIDAAMAYVPPPRPVEWGDLLEIMVKHKITSLPQLLVKTKEQFPETTMPELSKLLWANHYNIHDQNTIGYGDRTFILWNNKLLPVDESLPISYEEIERLEVLTA